MRPALGASRADGAGGSLKHSSRMGIDGMRMCADVSARKSIVAFTWDVSLTYQDHSSRSSVQISEFHDSAIAATKTQGHVIFSTNVLL